MGTIWLLRCARYPCRLFVKQLGFTQQESFVTFGAFAALVYGLVSVGGYVGDHILGTKRTMVLGAIVLASGYFLMGFSILHKHFIFYALGAIAVGNGLFKANHRVYCLSVMNMAIVVLMVRLPYIIWPSISAHWFRSL